MVEDSERNPMSFLLLKNMNKVFFWKLCQAFFWKLASRSTSCCCVCLVFFLSHSFLKTVVHVTEENLGKLPTFVSRVCACDPSAALQLHPITFAFRENSITHIQKSHNQGSSQVRIERKGHSKAFVF